MVACHDLGGVSGCAPVSDPGARILTAVYGGTRKMPGTGRTGKGPGDGLKGKSAEWQEGYREGWRRMRSEIGDRLRPVLRKFSFDLANDKTRDADDLIEVSRVYAYVYGTLSLFEKQLKAGRLISEPEIRFARLASPDEMAISFEELTRIWSRSE